MADRIGVYPTVEQRPIVIRVDDVDFVSLAVFVCIQRQTLCDWLKIVVFHHYFVNAFTFVHQMFVNKARVVVHVMLKHHFDGAPVAEIAKFEVVRVTSVRSV